MTDTIIMPPIDNLADASNREETLDNGGSDEQPSILRRSVFDKFGYAKDTVSSLLATAIPAGVITYAVSSLNYKLSPGGASTVNSVLGYGMEALDGQHYFPQVTLGALATAAAYSMRQMSKPRKILDPSVRSTDELINDPALTNERGRLSRIRRTIVAPLIALSGVAAVIGASAGMTAVNTGITNGQTKAVEKVFGHMPEYYQDPSRLTVITQKGGGNTFMNDSSINPNNIPGDAVTFSKALFEADDRSSGIAISATGLRDNVLGDISDSGKTKLYLNGVLVEFDDLDPEMVSMQRDTAVLETETFEKVFGRRPPFGAILNRYLSSKERLSLEEDGMQVKNGQEWLDGMKDFMRNNAVAALAVASLALAGSAVSRMGSSIKDSVKARRRNLAFAEVMADKKEVIHAEALSAIGKVAIMSPLAVASATLFAKAVEAFNLGLDVNINIKNMTTIISIMALTAWNSARCSANQAMSGDLTQRMKGET